MAKRFSVDTGGTLMTSLVSYYKLGDTSDFNGSNTLTNNNAATFVDGKINKGAKFVRASSQSLQSALLSSATDNFSASLWVNIPSSSEYGCFFHNGDPVVAGGDDGWAFGVGGSVFDSAADPGNNLLILRNGVAWQTAVGAIGTGWHHIVVLRDAGTWKGYIDGTVGTTSTGNPTAPTVGTLIGANNTDGAAPAMWNDKIDEVGYWDKVLSTTEIADLYNAGAGNSMYPSIEFDVAGNSGAIAAASSFSGSATWNGSNRALAVDVSLLGAGVTVTAMTYGGANCTFIGAQSTVTSFGRVEQWRIVSSDPSAPAVGANTLSVTLSGSLEFSVEWVSYMGVHQTSPTEAFNSNQATNAGSATDATVTVTTVADEDWVHAAVVANDTAITAGNTTRNNIAGTLGSGGNEDNGAAKTPAGTVDMSYTGMGITTTWAIAGFGLRPITASSLAPIVGAAVRRLRTLMGAGQ